MHYWDGQPVRFVCCQRKGSVLNEDGSDGGSEDDVDEEGDEPWGRVFWCVAIELAEDGEEVAAGGVDEGKEMSAVRAGVDEDDVD